MLLLKVVLPAGTASCYEKQFDQAEKMQDSTAANGSVKNQGRSKHVLYTLI